MEILEMKALSSDSTKDFLMNFQQIKPTCCDVMLWFAVYIDCVKYWVLKNTDIYEGQVMITRENIDSIRKFQVEGRALRQAIIEKYEK